MHGGCDESRKRHGKVIELNAYPRPPRRNMDLVVYLYTGEIEFIEGGGID